MSSPGVGTHRIATVAPVSDVPTQPDGPLVIAHRGSSFLKAEHTIDAYRQAIADGADALECDARLTSDGVLVCLHDRRIDRTSDGRGVVSSKTYAELSERDFRSWKGVDAAEVADGGGLMTLRALVELVLAADRPVGLSIETKHPVRYAGLVEERVMDMLHRYDLLTRKPDRPRVRLMSFSEVALRRVYEIAPGLETVFLMERVPMRARTGWPPSNARIAGPGIHIIRAHPHYVDRVHSAGRKVHVWTVDEPEDIDLCVKLGVDAIITNRPRVALERLGRS